MINILVVDDIQENLDVMELLIEEYMADDDIDLYLEVENIVRILDQTKELLSKFRELEDLYICIDSLSKKLASTDLDTVSESNQIKVSTFIKTIIFDIIELKDQIFVDRSTNNIYYAHASIASACLQINNYLK